MAMALQTDHFLCFAPFYLHLQNTCEDSQFSEKSWFYFMFSIDLLLGLSVPSWAQEGAGRGRLQGGGNSHLLLVTAREEPSTGIWRKAPSSCSGLPVPSTDKT